MLHTCMLLHSASLAGVYAIITFLAMLLVRLQEYSNCKWQDSAHDSSVYACKVRSCNCVYLFICLAVTGPLVGVKWLIRLCGVIGGADACRYLEYTFTLIVLRAYCVVHALGQGHAGAGLVIMTNVCPSPSSCTTLPCL